MLSVTEIVLLRSVADPDFELRRGPSSILLAQAAFRPSVISSFFTQNKGEARAPWEPPLDPPLQILRKIKITSSQEPITCTLVI